MSFVWLGYASNQDVHMHVHACTIEVVYHESCFDGSLAKFKRCQLASDAFKHVQSTVPMASTMLACII